MRKPLEQQALRALLYAEVLILMPTKPKKPCKHTGCPLLTSNDYCEFHDKLHAKDRAGGHERGYSYQWQKARKKYLTENTLCRECFKNGKYVPATVVDHIIPHRGDKSLFWEQKNWQPLCKSCHDAKTMTEDRYQEYKH